MPIFAESVTASDASTAHRFMMTCHVCKVVVLQIEDQTDEPSDDGDMPGYDQPALSE